MSQYLLALGVEASLLPKSIKLIPASTDQFLTDAAERIFGADAASEAVTVTLDDDDIDVILLRAQREMIEGKRYEETSLNALLIALSKAAKRVALWYGSDFVDLEPVCDLKSLTRVVRDGVSSQSVEVYALFERQ